MAAIEDPRAEGGKRKKRKGGKLSMSYEGKSERE